MRSAGAVIAGLVFIFVLSMATDAVMHVTGVFPPMGQPMSNQLFILATIYRIAYSVVGCYVAARLAPDRPMRHALILGAIGVVISTIGTIVTWNKGPEFGPHWYPIALIVVSMPCAWLGGLLRERQLRTSTPAL